MVECSWGIQNSLKCCNVQLRGKSKAFKESAGEKLAANTSSVKSKISCSNKQNGLSFMMIGKKMTVCGHGHGMCRETNTRDIRNHHGRSMELTKVSVEPSLPSIPRLVRPPVDRPQSHALERCPVKRPVSDWSSCGHNRLLPPVTKDRKSCFSELCRN